MLTSTKIALLCGVLVVGAPACALLVGDFEPAVTGSTGGAGGATSSSGVVTSNVTVGAGGMTTGPGSVTSGPSSGSGGGGGESSSSGSDPATSSAATTSVASSSNVASSSSGVMCVDPSSNCPAPPPCLKATCVGGMCSTTPVASGTPGPDQTPGDCHLNACDGNGSLANMVLDSDVPAPTNDCYTASCSAGVPKQTPRAINSGCNSNGGSYCDGMGSCVECNITLQCGGPGCVNHTCSGATCNDFMQNGDETDQDCGGSCKKCNFGQMCMSNFDCNSNFCSAGTCG